MLYCMLTVNRQVMLSVIQLQRVLPRHGFALTLVVGTTRGLADDSVQHWSPCRRLFRETYGGQKVMIW